jgi:hypothetical protein
MSPTDSGITISPDFHDFTVNTTTVGDGSVHIVGYVHCAGG